MTSDINKGSKMLVMAPNLVSDYIDDRKTPVFINLFGRIHQPPHRASRRLSPCFGFYGTK